MPISPENKDRYPKNWKEIRAEILKRAENKCECCTIKNHAMGYRQADGTFIKLEAISPEAKIRLDHVGVKFFRTVLTIAHMDHTPENCDQENLKALCKRCHNRYDQKHRLANRQRRKEEQKCTKE